jgi:hypothetical protein
MALKKTYRDRDLDLGLRGGIHRPSPKKKSHLVRRSTQIFQCLFKNPASLEIARYGKSHLWLNAKSREAERQNKNTVEKPNQKVAARRLDSLAIYYQKVFNL